MAKQVNKLKIVAPNKTVVFWSPIEGDDVLVRTGIIQDGSSFFHSLLYGYSKEYLSMDDEGRKKFVRRLKASIAGNVTKESWERVGGKLIAKIPFQENINYILSNIYRFLLNDTNSKGRSTKKVVKKLFQTNKNDLQVYVLLTELISLETYEQMILPQSYSQTEDSSIAICKDVIIKKSIDFLHNRDEMKVLDKQKAKYIEKCLHTLLKEILDEAQESAFQTYVKGLENVSEEVDPNTIKLVSDRINRDVYFIDGKERLPYNDSPTFDNLRERKSLIVICIDKNNYEIVGRLLPGNRIQREFSHNDVLIQKLYTFLLNPSQIPIKYPELNSYLPKKYKVDKSDSNVNKRINNNENNEYNKDDSDINSSDEDDEPWDRIRDSSDEED